MAGPSVVEDASEKAITSKRQFPEAVQRDDDEADGAEDDECCQDWFWNGVIELAVDHQQIGESFEARDDK